jgi:hypothetical protein
LKKVKSKIEREIRVLPNRLINSDDIEVEIVVFLYIYIYIYIYIKAKFSFGEGLNFVLVA